ncbi:hypothetical protein SELMODRAFT_444786 [Selaginella moellendorffii]|uniref:Macro domain-containing protein n=1 Tax=Selaginella moellendorffii TaxID=88036 RepID=D8SCZ8_SELML|nr:hypothetical protein SELMODRAFT_444786 [Selaginella moellendorffii]
MQLAAVSQARVSPPLGIHSSGLFGDVRPGNFAYLPAATRNSSLSLSVRACTGAPGSPPPSGTNGTADSLPKELPTRPTASTATSDRKFSRPPPFSGFSGSLGLNFPGSQIPGLPGSPRPKPGTPRPYDPTKQKSKVMEWLTPPKPPTELLQREHFKLSPTCLCTIYFGDLSKWFVDGKQDAVIAPANKKLNTGPAVNAVLFKAAGSKLLECTQRLPDVAPQGIKAEMGDAISTRAFDLPVHRVIHTVGAVHKKNEKTGVRESDPTLEKAYRTALLVARKEKLKYLAFPPLSCNIYGYPYADGAEVALRTLKDSCEGFERIDIVIRNIEGYEAFIDEANKVLEVIKEKKTIKVPAMAPRTTDYLPPAAAAAAAATQPASGVPTTPAELYPMPAAQSAGAPPAEAAQPAAPAPEATSDASGGRLSSQAATPAAASAPAPTPAPAQASQAPAGYSQPQTGYGTQQQAQAPGGYGATQSPYSQPPASGGGYGQSPYSQAPSQGGYAAAGTGQSPYAQGGQPPYSQQGGYGAAQSPYSQAPAPGGYSVAGAASGQSPYSQQAPAQGGYSAAGGGGQAPYSQQPPRQGGYSAAGAPGGYSAAGTQAPPAGGGGYSQGAGSPYSQSGGYGAGYSQAPPASGAPQYQNGPSSPPPYQNAPPYQQQQYNQNAPPPQYNQYQNSPPPQQQYPPQQHKQYGSKEVSHFQHFQNRAKVLHLRRRGSLYAILSAATLESPPRSCQSFHVSWRPPVDLTQLWTGCVVVLMVARKHK